MTTKNNPESVDQAKLTGQSGSMPKQAEGAHTGEVGDVNEFPEWQEDPALVERRDIDIQADEDATTEEHQRAKTASANKASSGDQAQREREQKQQADSAPPQKKA